MDLLAKAINRLEKLDSQTRTTGNSAAGITAEISYFMQDLPEVIEDLKQHQIELENENDSGGGRSRE